MYFSSSKNVALAATISAVRLPRPAASCPSLQLASPNPKGVRAALATPADQRARHRADQSRYQAKCRVAMSF